MVSLPPTPLLLLKGTVDVISSDIFESQRYPLNLCLGYQKFDSFLIVAFLFQRHSDLCWETMEVNPRVSTRLNMKHNVIIFILKIDLVQFRIRNYMLGTFPKDFSQMATSQGF